MAAADERLVFLDTETTGLDHESGDRIIEVAAIACVGRAFVDAPEGVFHALIDPERDVPAEAIAIHGITQDQLQGKPKFAAVADQLMKFLEGAEVVIHNADFDCGFINAELKICGMSPLDEASVHITDSLQLARRMYPQARNDLDSLCLRCGIDVRARRPKHSALIDAQLLGEAYLHMTSGQSSFELDRIDVDELQVLEDGAAFEVHRLAPDEAAAKRHRAYLQAMKERSGVEPLLGDGTK